MYWSCVFLTDETLLVVTADHSHSFVIYGKTKRGTPIFGFSGHIPKDGLPVLTLAYANGPGGLKLGQSRANLTGINYNATDFRQQALILTSSEDHAGEDVGMLKTLIKRFNCMNVTVTTAYRTTTFEISFLGSSDTNHDSLL